MSPPDTDMVSIEIFPYCDHIKGKGQSHPSMCLLEYSEPRNCGAEIQIAVPPPHSPQLRTVRDTRTFSEYNVDAFGARNAEEEQTWPSQSSV